MFGVDSQIFELVFEARDHATPVIDSLGEKMRGVLSIGAGGLLAGLGFEAFSGIEEGLSGLIGGAIQANMNVQSLKMTLQAIYGDAREATDAFTWVTAFEKRVPFNLQDIQQAAVSVAALGDDISKVLPALATMSSVAQVPLQTATQAFQDAQNGLNRMLERDLHVRPEELVPFGLKIDRAGKEDLTTFAAAFEKFAAARYPDAIANQMNTLQGKLSSLETQWYNIKIALGKPLFDVLQVDAQRLLDWLNTHQDDVKQFATNVGEGLASVAGTLSLAVPQAITLIQKGIAGVKKEWDTLKADIGDVGDFFSGVGMGIHEVLFTVTKGLEDIMNSMFDTLGQGINSFVNLVNGALHKIYAATGGRAGEPPDSNIGGVNIDIAKQNMQEQIFLSNLFPDLDPRTGKPWTMHGGGGSDTLAPNASLGTTSDYGLYAASGGTLRYVPKTGGTGGSSGSNGNPDLSVRGMGGEGDPQALLAAAQAAYKDASNRLSIDELLKAPLVTLKADIAAIMKDYSNPLLGNSPSDIQLKNLELQKEIGQTTKDAVVKTLTSPLASFRLQQEAGYGQALISLGSTQQANLSEQVRQLLATVASDHAIIANLTAQLAAKEANNATAKQTAQHAAATASHTKRVADAASKPGPSLTQTLRAGGVALAHR